jgi:hypothetical protein
MCSSSVSTLFAVVLPWNPTVPRFYAKPTHDGIEATKDHLGLGVMAAL